MQDPLETSFASFVKEQVLAVLTYMVIFMLVCWTWDLFNREVNFVRRMFYSLLFAWISYFIHPPIGRAVMFARTLWSAVLWSELLVNEYREWKSHRVDKQHHLIGKRLGQYWERVAALRPSGHDIDVRYFSAIICDTNVLDDPFWSDHVSTIFTVEKRRRNMIWSTIRIWQVSLLNGEKKKVHQFHQFWQLTDGQPFRYRCTRADDVACFQSRGVIFILMREMDGQSDDQATLLVYDTRFKKSASYELELLDRQEQSITKVISITCLGRLVDEDESVEGWRIRILDAADNDQIEPNGLLTYRACIINEIFEMREEACLISSEDIVFGRFLDVPSLVRVRTSRGHFGVCATKEDCDIVDQSPIVLFNEITSDYAFFRSFDDLILMDRRLGTYVYSYPTFPWLPYTYPKYMCPAFLNDREAIWSKCCGCVYRTDFRPSSIKYLMAKSLFRSIPQLRTRVDAKGFRHLTGIEDMEGHFG